MRAVAISDILKDPGCQTMQFGFCLEDKKEILSNLRGSWRDWICILHNLILLIYCQYAQWCIDMYVFLPAAFLWDWGQLTYDFWTPVSSYRGDIKLIHCYSICFSHYDVSQSSDLNLSCSSLSFFPLPLLPMLLLRLHD